MAKNIGTGAKWAEELVDVLNEFVDEEVKTINSVFEETAQDTKALVGSLSPGDGDYASGWEVIANTKTDAFGDEVSYTVGNPKHYQLTHLLEKGHAVANQYGGPSRPGAKKRVSARRHIKPAEVWGNNVLLARLRAKL